MALRGIAEVHHHRGDVTEALAAYRRALALAPQDADLEQAVETLERSMSATPAAENASPASRVTTPAAIDPGEDQQRGQLRSLQKFLDQILADRARRPAARA
jgi:tetratricopeptide (TPR) repeat protein